MIRKVHLTEMQICSDVIRESFLPIAVKLNITKENAPSYVAFSVTPERLKKRYLNGCEMYVYVFDKHIIGFFSLKYEKNECELNNLCVLPEYRHSGIGSELLQFAIKLLLIRKQIN